MRTKDGEEEGDGEREGVEREDILGEGGRERRLRGDTLGEGGGKKKESKG